MNQKCQNGTKVPRLKPSGTASVSSAPPVANNRYPDIGSGCISVGSAGGHERPYDPPANKHGPPSRCLRERRSPCPTAAAGRPLQLCSGPSGASSTDWARPLKLGIGGLRKVAFREFGTVIDFRLRARRSGNSSIDRTMIDRRRTLSTPRRSITMELHQSGRHWTLGRSSGILFTEDSSGIAAASGIRSLPNY
jgi:hypothetical protein